MKQTFITMPKRRTFFTGREKSAVQAKINFNPVELVNRIGEQQELILTMESDLKRIHAHLKAFKVSRKHLDLLSAQEIAGRYEGE